MSSTTGESSPLRTAVVGDPIEHSLSPVLMQAGAGIKCQRIRVASGGLRSFLRLETAKRTSTHWILPRSSGEIVETLRGLSVTMPLKVEALELANTVDPIAAKVGAVNTLAFAVSPELDSDELNVTIRGYNTDVYGIIQALANAQAEHPRGSAGSPSPLNLSKAQAGQEAVILGSGATACSALGALTQMGFDEVTVCARRALDQTDVPLVAQRLGVRVREWPLARAAEVVPADGYLISTLPAHVADPLAGQLEGRYLPELTVLDASYAEYPSKLMQTALASGAKNAPGWWMLMYQGAKQIEIFTGRSADVQAMRAALETHISDLSTTL